MAIDGGCGLALFLHGISAFGGGLALQAQMSSAASFLCSLLVVVADFRTTTSQVNF
jgi:hypothetical protein